MAVADWRRYYAPILVDKRTGYCRIWQGKLFREHGAAHVKAAQINACVKSNYRVIGVAGIRSRKKPSLQQLLYKESR